MLCARQSVDGSSTLSEVCQQAFRLCSFLHSGTSVQACLMCIASENGACTVLTARLRRLRMTLNMQCAGHTCQQAGMVQQHAALQRASKRALLL